MKCGPYNYFIIVEVDSIYHSYPFAIDVSISGAANFEFGFGKTKKRSNPN